MDKEIKPITLEEAKELKHGDILYHTKNKNADGTPQRWKVNGRVKTWKTRPNQVQIPIKQGLYSFDHLTERDLHTVTLSNNEI